MADDTPWIDLSAYGARLTRVRDDAAGKILLMPVEASAAGRLRIRPVVERLAQFGFRPEDLEQGIWVRDGWNDISVVDLLAVFPRARITKPDGVTPWTDAVRSAASKVVGWPDFRAYGIQLRLEEDGDLLMMSTGPSTAVLDQHSNALSALGFVCEPARLAWRKPFCAFVAGDYLKYFPEMKMSRIAVDGIAAPPMEATLSG